jgi:excisionase family DNA binding protein
MKLTCNAEEAAELMKVHPETAKELFRDGVIPAAKIGTSWVAKTSDVMAHVDREIARQYAQLMRTAPKKRSKRQACAA